MFTMIFTEVELLQPLLIFLWFIITLVLYWQITDIMLMIYMEKIEIWRRIIFVFFISILLRNIWIYCFFFIGNASSLPILIQNFIKIPNPLIPFIGLVLVYKIFKFSIRCSINLILSIYIYILILNSFQNLLSTWLIVQSELYLNFILEISGHLFPSIINSIVYFTLKYLVKKGFLVTRITDNVKNRSLIKSFINFFLSVICIYLAIVLLITYIPNNIIFQRIALLMICIFILTIRLYSDYLNSIKIERTNQKMLILKQNQLIEDFQGLRHDFNNILQSIGGYISIGDMDKLREYHGNLINLSTQLYGDEKLSRRMEENPALISLLINKKIYAESANLRFTINISCNILNLPIDELDLCRAVGNLLDNAIEAAQESENKSVEFSITEQKDKSKTISIVNSTKENINIDHIKQIGISSKSGHVGLGLPHTLKILNKYSNCVTKLFCYDYEFFVYINFSERRKSNY